MPEHGWNITKAFSVESHIQDFTTVCDTESMSFRERGKERMKDEK